MKCRGCGRKTRASALCPKCLDEAFQRAVARQQGDDTPIKETEQVTDAFWRKETENDGNEESAV